MHNYSANLCNDLHAKMFQCFVVCPFFLPFIIYIACYVSSDAVVKVVWLSYRNDFRIYQFGSVISVLIVSCAASWSKRGSYGDFEQKILVQLLLRLSVIILLFALNPHSRSALSADKVSTVSSNLLNLFELLFPPPALYSINPRWYS